jgi:hypothetical protein
LSEIFVQSVILGLKFVYSFPINYSQNGDLFYSLTSPSDITKVAFATSVSDAIYLLLKETKRFFENKSEFALQEKVRLRVKKCGAHLTRSFVKSNVTILQARPASVLWPCFGSATFLQIVAVKWYYGISPNDISPNDVSLNNVSPNDVSPNDVSPNDILA